MELLRVAIIIPLLEDRFNKNKKDFYMKWEDLNTQNRAELIKLYVRNGVTSLDKMKEHYNSFGEGGSLDKKKPKFPLQTYLDTLMYQEGGDKIYTATGKTATVKARKPDWQRGLTDYDWARARKYYPDGSGMVSDKGIEWLKHISKKRNGRNSGNEYLYAALRNVRDFYENDVIPRAQWYKQSYESQDNLNKKINNLKTVVSNLQPSNYIYKDIGQASGMFNPLTGYVYLKNKPNPELYFGPYGYTIQQGPLISHEDAHLEQLLNYPNYLNEREEYLLEKAYPYTEGVSKMYGPLAPIMKNKERQATNRQLRHELFNEDKLFIDDPFDINNFDESIKNGKFDYMIEDFIKNNYYFGRGKNYKPTKKDLDNVKEALLEVADNQNDLSNSYSNIMSQGGHLYQEGGDKDKPWWYGKPGYKFQSEQYDLQQSTNEEQAKFEADFKRRISENGKKVFQAGLQMARKREAEKAAYEEAQARYEQAQKLHDTFFATPIISQQDATRVAAMPTQQEYERQVAQQQAMQNATRNEQLTADRNVYSTVPYELRIKQAEVEDWAKKQREINDGTANMMFQLPFWAAAPGFMAAYTVADEAGRFAGDHNKTTTQWINQAMLGEGHDNNILGSIVLGAGIGGGIKFGKGTYNEIGKTTAARNAFNTSDFAKANDLYFTRSGSLKQGANTYIEDATTGELRLGKPTTIKKMKNPITGREVKPRTVLKDMQKNPQAYNDYFLQEQWQHGQGGRDWFANFGREQQGVPRIGEGTPIITEENAASITPKRWTAAQDAAIESGRGAKTEIVPTWLSQEMIDRARSTTLENVLKNDEIISDYQFTQIFGVSKSEYMKQFENNANLLRKSGWSENEIKQWVKDVAEQHFKSDIEGQQKFRDDLSVLIKSEGEEPKDFILDSNNGILSNFRRGNISIKDVRDVFRKMYKLLDSKEYKQRIINDGYSEEEATDMIKLFKGLMQNVKKAKYKDNLISQHGGAVYKTLNADGVYVHGADIVGIISKSSELSKAEKETLIHELFHSSDKGEPEAYMKRIKWMEPLDKSDKEWTEYMTKPTEQRVRALSALSDMKEMGLDLTDPASYEKYFNMPKHDRNYDDLIKSFGKEQTHNFMRTIYGISIPLLLYGTTQK